MTGTLSISRTISKKFLFASITFVFICIFSVIILEILARLLLKESPYLPGPQIKKIQFYVKSHPLVGFLLKENISYSDNILFPWNDQIVAPLSTDRYGFQNHPRAISLSEQKQHINIIGLGDSFIYSADRQFYKRFSEYGLYYYNLAVFRHCPPQYNLILREYAAPLKPDWVIYGVYKNDFSETVDFENWKKTNLDWFTYHSGFWAGPAIDKSKLELFLSRYLRGCYAVYKTIKYKYLRWKKCVFSGKGNQESVSEEEPRQIEKVHSYILRAYEMARANNIKFLFLLIPDKVTMLTGDSNRKAFYYQFLNLVQSSNIPTLDLYEKFAKMPRVQELYYKIDSHWNFNGMNVAADAILEFIRNN